MTDRSEKYVFVTILIGNTLLTVYAYNRNFTSLTLFLMLSLVIVSTLYYRLCRGESSLVKIKLLQTDSPNELLYPEEEMNVQDFKALADNIVRDVKIDQSTPPQKSNILYLERHKGNEDSDLKSLEELLSVLDDKNLKRLVISDFSGEYETTYSLAGFLNGVAQLQDIVCSNVFLNTDLVPHSAIDNLPVFSEFNKFLSEQEVKYDQIILFFDSKTLKTIKIRSEVAREISA